MKSPLLYLADWQITLSYTFFLTVAVERAKTELRKNRVNIFIVVIRFVETSLPTTFFIASKHVRACANANLSSWAESNTCTKEESSGLVSRLIGPDTQNQFTFLGLWKSDLLVWIV